MKRLIFTAAICLMLLSIGSALAADIEPGMSAQLKRGAYYGIGTDIPEGSYIFTCLDNEETDWADACEVFFSSYEFLQIHENNGRDLDFPELDDGTYGPVRAFLKAGTIMRIRYSDVIITAAEPVIFK